MIEYYENGNKSSEAYRKNGELHREDGPADIWYYENGLISSQCWYKDGKELKVIPKYMLEAYMKSNDIKLVELLTSNNKVVLKSVNRYKWKEVI